MPKYRVLFTKGAACLLTAQSHQINCQKWDLAMRILATTLLMLAVIYGTNAAQAQQSSCKVCSEQQHACMKNYAGPTCKSEYRMCLKSCGKKS
jgi:hypothetical protein